MSIRNLLALFALLMCAALALPAPTPAALAQTDTTQPIFFLRNGDIYRYDPATNALAQETSWGYNDAPRLSHNGQYLAYNSIASHVVQSLGAQAGTFGATFSNIWIANANNTTNSDYVRIASQPSNVTNPSITSSGTGIMRSTPDWSLGALELAWLEYDTTVSPAMTRLVTYSFITNTQRVVKTGVSLGFQDGGIFLSPPKFGYGIVAYSYFDAPNPNSGFSGFTQVIEFYDTNTGTLLNTLIADAENNTIQDFVWLADMIDTVALLRDDGSFETYNVRTGSSVSVQSGAAIGTLSLLNVSNLNAQLRATYTDTTFSFQWIGRVGNTFSTFTTIGVEGAVAMSPSGDGFAYRDNTGALWVTRNGLLQIVPGTASNANRLDVTYGPIWGPTAYHIKNEVGTADVMTCTSAPAPRLTAGSSAQVIAGVGGVNALRGAPGTGPGSAEFGAIPEGATMIVLSGPFCGSGFNWYLVNYAGKIGYTAEGDTSGVYWLQPA